MQEVSITDAFCKRKVDSKIRIWLRPRINEVLLRRSQTYGEGWLYQRRKIAVISMYIFYFMKHAFKLNNHVQNE